MCLVDLLCRNNENKKKLWGFVLDEKINIDFRTVSCTNSNKEHMVSVISTLQSHDLPAIDDATFGIDLATLDTAVLEVDNSNSSRSLANAQALVTLQG